MRAWCLVVAVAAVAGCSSTSDGLANGPAPAPPSAETHWSGACESCYEPYLAWDGQGALWLATNFPASLQRSVDGGHTFLPVDVPGTPDGMEGDVFVEQDIALWPDGRYLWWTSMVQDDVPNNTGNSIRIARTGDVGATWDVNAVVRWPVEQGDAGHASDRPWVIAREGLATVAAAQPTGFFAHLASFEGGRQTDAQPVPLASVRSTALGRPAAAPDGRWVVPFVRNLGPYINGHVADASFGQLQALVGTVGSAEGQVVTIAEVAGPGAPASPGVPSAAWDGSFVVASVTPAGTVQLWTSPDGASWSPGAAVDGGTVVGQPWVEATGGRLVVAWFRVAGQGFELVTWDGSGPGMAPILLPATQTDFPAVSLDASGRMALAWLEEGTLNVRVG